MSDSDQRDDGAGAVAPAGGADELPGAGDEASGRDVSPWLEPEDREEEAARAKREHVRNELDKFASEFLLQVSPNLELTGANLRAGALALGYGEEWEGHRVTDFLHPDDIDKVLALTERARRTPGFEEGLQVRAQHKDGTWRMLDLRVFDASLRSDLAGVVVRVRDVTDEHNAKVTASDIDRFSSLAEMLPFGILSADARGWVVYSNEAARQILNLSREMVSGHGWEQAVAADDWDEVSAAASRVVAAGISETTSFRVDTTFFPRFAEAKFVPLGSPSEPTGWIATVEDITDRRRAEGELAHLATHDPLTGLPNRALLDDRLEQARGRLQRGTATSITVLFVDLDAFKAINDNHGHQVGDAVLVEVARRLRSVLRDVDTVARLGGDEFVAVCESLPVDEAAALERRIADTLDRPLLVGDTSIPIGASVGNCRTTDGMVELADLLARADDDMYQHKQQRKADRRR
jgi:diguanylate cyclase (GGDEF)-like protein/PAS domain S-box-containing protein